jgi:hypothetical protein
MNALQQNAFTTKAQRGKAAGVLDELSSRVQNRE